MLSLRPVARLDHDGRARDTFVVDPGHEAFIRCSGCKGKDDASGGKAASSMLSAWLMFGPTTRAGRSLEVFPRQRGP